MEGRPGNNLDCGGKYMEEMKVDMLDWMKEDDNKGARHSPGDSRGYTRGLDEMRMILGVENRGWTIGECM